MQGPVLESELSALGDAGRVPPPERPDGGGGHAHNPGFSDRQPKVRHLRDIVGVEDDVARLQVSVDNARHLAAGGSSGGCVRRRGAAA